MKFQVNRKQFLAKLTALKPLIGMRTYRPYSTSIKFSLAGDLLWIHATNLDTHSRTAIETRGEEGILSWSSCHREVLAAVKSVKGGMATISISMDPKEGWGKMEVGGDVGCVSIHAVQADDFPEIPPWECNDFYSVGARELGKALERTSYAVLKNTDKPSRLPLTGVLFEMNGDSRLVASDACRVSTIEIESQPSGSPNKIR